ncbi:MAG: cytochrome c biogenesis protein CcsA [Paludibacteraceae bacterium]|nr:cytochrome c biogenesis protein CcsA [Paludibacteraceae bacterium]
MLFRSNAEIVQIYNQLNVVKPLAFVCLTLGLLLFALYVYRFSMQKKPNRIVRYLSLAGLLLMFIFLSVLIALRSAIVGYFPLANGYEVMHFLAWTALLLKLLFYRRFQMLLPFGFLLCGFSLLVATMGEANPQITALKPVLSSPLLSAHVVVIMFSYALLAFIMLNGLTAILLHCFSENAQRQIERLKTISHLMLYPAVFCLAIGIFVGAIWANLTWGRYWGWDPKEVWALITMMVYSTAFHSKSLPFLQKPLYFHIFTVVAFLAVLFTYFGVNFLLGGLHSYV